jgi:lysophospholipase L1-like esterase
VRNRRRTVLVAVGALIIILGAVGGGVLVKKQLDNDRNCESVTDWVESRGDLLQVGDGVKKVAILGDSYAAGDLLPDRTQGWVYKLAESQDWTGLVDGVGYTGFINGGFCGDQPYASRAAAITAANPDLLIIEGGLNDAGKSSDEVKAAARDLLGQFESVPQVVIVGPVNAPAREGLAAVDAGLAEATSASSRQYVSALDWQLTFLPDQLHLTPESHARFAALVSEGIDP